MRRLFRLATFLFVCGVSRAGADAHSDRPQLPKTVKLDLVSSPADSTLLPLRLPGYELRVLDARKLLFFNVEGSWVEIPLPILFYFPIAEKSEAVRLVRQTADALRGLGGIAGAAPSDAAFLAAQLDRAAALLE